MKDKKHSEWLKKFNKRKEGKIFNLLQDIRAYESNLKHYDKKTHLASALSIATKGTKMEKDTIELITIICPEFFTTN